MRILFVVDGRSPIALNWIGYFANQGHDVHLVSTFQCDPEMPLGSFEFIPVAFSSAKVGRQSLAGGKSLTTRGRGIWGARLVGVRTGVRQWLGPFTITIAANKLVKVLRRVKPDLIHAMRIPYEGMLAAAATGRLHSTDISVPPLVVSVWGNDFTLHAAANFMMASFTRRVLQWTDGLHTDCKRDQRLAFQWGFANQKPAIVLPGNGGIQLDLFYPSKGEVGPVVINPRGIRAYIRNDIFFQAIPEVLKRLPATRFLCTGMAGDKQVSRWVTQLGIHHAVELLPTQTHPAMAELFRRAQVAVSPSIHDGTPNTLLEAMACGCFPVAGDIESLREWITPGENGLLFDPNDSGSLAEALCKALSQPERRRTAAEINHRLVTERADYTRVMPEAELFYRRMIEE